MPKKINPKKSTSPTEDKFGGGTMIGKHGNPELPENLKYANKPIRSNKKKRTDQKKSDKLDRSLEGIDKDAVLKFLRDEVNGGMPFRAPTFKEVSSPEEARKIETSSLTIKYEKIHGKGSLSEALKSLPEAQGSAFYTEEGNLDGPGRSRNMGHLLSSEQELNKHLKNVRELTDSGDQTGNNFYKNAGAGAVAAAAVLVGAKVVMKAGNFVGSLFSGPSKPKGPDGKAR